MLTPDVPCRRSQGCRKIISCFLKFCRITNLQNTLTSYTDIGEERRTEKGDTVFLQAPDVKNGVQADFATTK